MLLANALGNLSSVSSKSSKRQIEMQSLARLSRAVAHRAMRPTSQCSKVVLIDSRYSYLDRSARSQGRGFPDHTPKLLYAVRLSFYTVSFLKNDPETNMKATPNCFHLSVRLLIIR